MLPLFPPACPCSDFREAGEAARACPVVFKEAFEENVDAVRANDQGNDAFACACM